MKISGSQLYRIRRKLDLTLVEFAHALGYSGTYASMATVIWRFESGERPIPERIAWRAWELDGTLATKIKS